MAIFGSDTKNEAQDAAEKGKRDIQQIGRDAKDSADRAAQEAKDKTKAAIDEIKDARMKIPAFSDIAKAANDLLTKDFYHQSAANLEVKSKTVNGVNYTVKGKSAHDNTVTGSLEGKYAHKESGTTGTVTWSTLNVLDAKLELDENIANGLKIESLTSFKPDNQALSEKVNFHFKHSPFHIRLFSDLMKGPTATLDAVMGHDGFIVGGEASYDVEKAAITRYSAALGYQNELHNFAVTSTDNLSVFAASYYQKVNEQVEVGAKATWDSKGSSAVGLELASKYAIDPASFAKAKVNDQGIAALAYNVLVKEGFTFGIGASFDTQKLNEASHKVGAHFSFEG